MLCSGIDLSYASCLSVQREGLYPAPPGESDLLGLEVAGEIVHVEEKDSPWRVGDRVMSLVGGGGYAQYATAYTGHLMHIPDNMSFSQAACVSETYITAFLNLFLLANTVDGNTVLLHGGGGGVTSAGIQLLQHLTPKSTIVVTSSPGKVDRVKAQGAHLVLDYTSQDGGSGGWPAV